MISGHAMFLAVNQFAQCIKNEWKQCSFFSPPATVILLLFLTFEALLFAVFTLIMLGTQINAIWNDETVSLKKIFLLDVFICIVQSSIICNFNQITTQGIEQLKKEEASWVKKSRWKSIQSVFGRFSIAWFSPFTKPTIKSKIDRNFYSV